MERSYNTAKIIGALTFGTMAGVLLGVILTLNQENKIRREVLTDTKYLAKKLRKKAQKEAKNMCKEEWLANEKDQFVNHTK